MKPHDLTLVIEYKGSIDRLANYCYGEFSDGTVCSRDGEFFIDLTREGSSLEEVIKSALQSAKNIGITVKHIQLFPDQISKTL